VNISFSHLITSFFTNYLASERGLSENTVASYSDWMKLLINYACGQCKVGPEGLRMDMFTRELILDFLRRASPATQPLSPWLNLPCGAGIALGQSPCSPGGATAS